MKYYFNNYLYSFASELSDNIDFIISNNPTIQSEIQSLPIKYKKWLADRFGKSPALSEIHPVQDCLSTLKKFYQREDGISAKYKSNQQFKNDIDNEFPTSDRGWLNPTDITLLSIDNMEKILSLSEKKKTKVKLDSGANYESDRVGKVGPWNIWLPSSRENSINIAGYNPETNTEYTTWCTARITGSNLFYNYVKPNFMLFYVIKDNPTGDNDWLSIGVLGGQIVYNGDGRESVNRDNKGLTEKSLKSILSGAYEEVVNTILSKFKDLSGLSPARKKIEEASKDINKLKDIIKGNSKDEAQSMLEGITQDLLKYYKEPVLSGTENIDVDINKDILNYLYDNGNLNTKLYLTMTNDEKIIEKLVTEPSYELRSIAVVKKRKDKSFLMRMSEDENENVREKVLYWIGHDESLLKKFITDPSPDIRVKLVFTTKDKATLEELTKDSDPYVRAYAKQELIKLMPKQKSYFSNVISKIFRKADIYYRLTNKI